MSQFAVTLPFNSTIVPTEPALFTALITVYVRAVSALTMSVLNELQLTGTVPSFTLLTALAQLFVRFVFRLLTLGYRQLNDNLLTGTVPAFASLSALQLLFVDRSR